jgi:hydrophobic/amphiphilic exporter-1 (mainly G- bacteria), HAE1 family
LGRIERPRDFAQLIVANVNGAPVRISDIGRVEDSFEEPRSMARLNGQNAVVLEVQKQSGTNSLQVIQAVKDRTAELQKTLPGDFEIRFMRDQSDFIREAFEAVQAHLVEGGIFAALIVLLFIRSWRSTLIAAISIPTSIISTYTLMNYMGFTLNQITMLALVLMVGIVIDDAIVVLENIFKMAEEKGMDPMQAAVEGTREIGLAVMATTASLIVVFLPVALMEGIVGRFMSSFGYTAAFAVGVSLLVSFTLTPMLCARFLKVKHGGETKDGWLFRVLSGAYGAMLRWSMNHRWAIVALSLAVMATSVPLFNAVGKDFLPVDDQAEFEVLMRLPPGSSLTGTETYVRQLEDELKGLPGVRNLLTTIGADQLQKVDRGSIIVGLVPMAERNEGQDEIMNMARERLRRFRDLTISIQRPALVQGGGPNKNLQFTIQGPDLNLLDKYAQTLRAKLESLPGVEDVESSFEAGKPELRVKINRDRAADLNVNVASIATALRTLVGGDEQATTYREGDDRMDVMLRVDKQFRDSPDALERLYVPSSTLGNVPVANVASFEPATGPTQIERYNRQRQILLTANIVAGNSLSNVLAILDQEIAALNLPPGYSTAPLGTSREFARAGQAFVIAFLLSVIFMYMILAAQFESFLDPFIILLSLPLSVPFAVLSLFLARENYQIIYSSVGILVLFGIVKKNAILQIDHIKNLRREGVPRLEAILRGCEDRLRPILMTTAALVAGMIPLALGGGAGSGSRRSVAIIVIGGQTLCLLLTLLITPVAYSLSDDLSSWFGRVFWRKAKTVPKEVAAGLMLMLLAPSLVEAQQARVGVSAQRKLTLQEAVELALGNNLEIEVERQNQQIARRAAEGALGAFDPFFRFAPTREDRTTPTPSVLVGSGGKLQEGVFSSNVSAGQRLNFYGSQVRLDFNNSRSSTNNPFVGLNPYYSTSLALSYVQPLLRGRMMDAERANILIRRKQVDSSDVDLELKAIDVVLRVEQAYWDLVALREDYVVKGEAVTLGEKQVGLTKRQIDAGTLAPVELAAAEAELERRRDTWFAALEFVTQAENALKLLVAKGREDAIWGMEIVPSEMGAVTPPESTDLGNSVEAALRKRPEMKGVALRQDANGIQRRLARELTKPQVNAVASYINSGLAGAVNTAPNPFQNLFPGGGGGGGAFALPANLLGGYGQSLSNLAGGSFPTFQVGLQLDLTGRNRAAKSQEAQTALQGRQLQLEQSRVAQLIEAQVRNAVQGIQTAEQRIKSADASATAAKQKLDSETRLFETGESTNFLVLTRQNEYADSRRRSVVARLDRNKAVSRLQQALGRMLESHQVALR